MENVHQMKALKLLGIVLLFNIFSSHGQDQFFVYRTQGAPFMEVNDSIKSVTKGSLIDKNTMLTMATDDVIFYLDAKHKVYRFEQQGTFKYKDLKKVTPTADKSTFTKKMFDYVWNQFTKTDVKEKNKSGVVYRGDAIVLMRHPADSLKIFNSEIKFEWNSIEDKTKEYYFILKDVESQKITRIGLMENSVSLFVDEGIITSGKSYEWAITETKFPNYEKTTFYSFKLLNASEFETLKKEIDAITEDLKTLGFDKNEIRAAICEDYKVCF